MHMSLLNELRSRGHRRGNNIILLFNIFNIQRGLIYVYFFLIDKS